MTAIVVTTPDQLRPADVRGRTVVVFDVLRATTTMTAALSAGVAEIRIFGSIDAARAAAGAASGKKLLCGEANCMPPPGFDLGNSPRDWTGNRYADYRVFMATTNGTRAIAAAAEGEPALLLAGALVNANAVAAAAIKRAADVTLLCAGTAGRLSLEDMIGAGAVLKHLMSGGGFSCAGDAAQMAVYLFEQTAGDLAAALRQGAGGRNLAAAGLEADIEPCARINSISAVGAVDSDAGGLACRCLRS